MCIRCLRAAGAGPRRGHPLSPLHCYVTILPLLYIFYVYIYILYSIYIYTYTWTYYCLYNIYTYRYYMNRIYIFIHIYIYIKTHVPGTKRFLRFFLCHLFLALTYGSLFSLDLFQYPLLLSHLRSKRDYPRGCGRGRCAGSRRVIHP